MTMEPEAVLLFRAIREGNSERVEALLRQCPHLVDAVEGERLSALRLAILCGYDEIAGLLVQYGADVNAVRHGESTPLMDAIGTRSTRLVRQFLKKGADPDVPGGQPLLSAAWYGDKPVVELLLAHGANANARDPHDGSSALHTAAEHFDCEVARTLIEHGADVNARSRRGWTPLKSAAGNGDITTVRGLLDAGADPSLPDDEGGTPLLAAACSDGAGLVSRDSEGGFTYQLGADANPPEVGQVHHGRTIEAVFDPLAGRDEAVHLLLERVGRDSLSIHEAVAVGDARRVSELLSGDSSLVDASIRTLGTPLHCAAGFGRLEIAGICLSHGADVDAKAEGLGATPLHVAAQAGELEMSRFLLSHGAGVNAHDKYDATPIMEGAASPELTRLFLESGADIDARDSDSMTALHYAAQSGNLESVQILVRAGADVNADGFCGDTPLHSAGNDEVARFLLVSGADASIRNADGETPLLDAIRSGAKRKADVLMEASTPDAFYMAALGDLGGLQELIGADLSLLYASDVHGNNRTLLHYAAEFGNAGVARFLLGEGIDPNVVDDRAVIPLHLAAESETSEVAGLLIAAGANVNVSDQQGFTPLHEAAYHLNYEVAELLIANGADLEARTENGCTPLSQSESRRMSMLLFRSGATH